MKPGAIVLCGGESRRMGQSKAWLPFGTERLLHRVVRLVGIAAHPIVVVAAAGQEIPELPVDVAIVRDPVDGRGPVQALAAGMASLPDAVELVYATATDAPFLEPLWITRLSELIGQHDLAIPRNEGRDHPLAALYRRAAVLPVLQSMLRENRLRLTEIVERVRTRIVAADELRPVDRTLRTLQNLNTPEDYERALREL